MLEIKCTMRNSKPGFKSNREVFKCKQPCANCLMIKIKSEVN